MRKVTKQDIMYVRIDAGHDGDSKLVALAERALSGDTRAMQKISQMIRDGKV